MLALAMTTDADDPVSRRLRWVIDHLNTNAFALSKRAGLSDSHVRKILERGGMGTQLETLGKVAAAAGCSLAWLATGVGQAFDEDVAQASTNDNAGSERLGDVPGIEANLRLAQAMRPQYDGLPVWSEIRHGEALADVEPTPVMLAELADWLVRHRRRRS